MEKVLNITGIFVIDALLTFLLHVGTVLVGVAILASLLIGFFGLMLLLLGIILCVIHVIPLNELRLSLSEMWWVFPAGVAFYVWVFKDIGEIYQEYKRKREEYRENKKK